MAGPIVGSIEHYIAANNSASWQGAFVSLYNFLVNASSSLGITRIAYNTGSQDTGMTQFRGMNYWDQANPCGQNAFAVFRFSNAARPFDMLIQWTYNSTFGTAPGNPGQASFTNLNYCLGIAFAQRIDGVTAWNGTTHNDGNDVKGTPVWTTASTTGLLSPRANSYPGGGSSAQAHDCLIISQGGTNVAIRFSVVADYDNIVLALEHNGAGRYGIAYFGKYTPISGTTHDNPYFSFCDRYATTTEVDLPYLNVVYGYPATSSPADGGVLFPVASASGTLAAGFDRMGTNFYQNTNAQPNKAYSTPIFNEFPLNVGILEDSARTGLLGQTDFIREIYGASTHDTNSDGTRVVLGNKIAAASVKITVPWHSGTTPGTGISRTGVQFSNP